MERVRGDRRTRTGQRVATLGSLAGAFLLLAAAAPARAVPGDLDLTFSGDGKQTTNMSFGSSRAAATVRQPDGKIVVVGGAGFDFALARYHPNGSLDTSFSGDGKVRTALTGEARGVALQGNGKIVVVGGGGDFALARYNPNGSLDTSFSGDGKQSTDFLGLADTANGVALQNDGKIVVVGDARTDDILNLTDFAIARYNVNGSPDTSFSADGKQTTEFGGFAHAAGVALQSDGKIVVVGDDAAESGDGFALTRYNTNGSPDTSFSTDGIETTDFGGTDRATGVALQSDGKIVAVGGGGAGDDFALARYNATNGSLDTSFSTDGKQTTDFGDADEATGVAIQGDGKVVAVGGAGDDFALARYIPGNGSLDTSFSGDGMETTDFGDTDQANGVALQADDKIVAVGSGGIGDDFAITRHNVNGSLDTSFSGDGKQTTDFGADDGASGVAIQDDGKIVAVGTSGIDDDFALARYNPNGSLDTSFSGDGKQFGAPFGAMAVALQGNGKIVVVGGGQDFALARYTRNGSLDRRFSGDGKQTTDFGPFDLATGVAIRGGKIVVVGSGGAENQNFALARYNFDGSLDMSFSGDGKQRTDFFGNNDGASAVALHGSGRIVAVGEADTGGPGFTDFAVARYNRDGSLDRSFSGDGKQTTGFQDFDRATGVAVQANGKIVAAGYNGGGGGDFALARYNPNGSLDTSFSGDGKQRTGFGGGDVATGLALQSGGKIVAAGGGGVGDDFVLARYNANGSLDASFSGDGKQTTDFGGFDFARAVALQGPGKIVAVGRGRGPGQTDDFALARYLGG